MQQTVGERRNALEAQYPTWERKTLARHFEDQCERYAQRTLLITPQHSYTYAHVWSESVRVAKALLAMGVRHRQHVAVLMANEPEFVFTIIGLSMVGAIAVPLNTMLREDELDFILRHSDSEWIVLHQEASGYQHGEIVARLVRKMVESGHEALKQVVVVPNGSTEPDPSFLTWDAWLTQAASIDDAALQERRLSVEYPDEVAMIIYTSGSTGVPKGVTLTHQNFLRCAYTTCLSRAFEDGRRIFTPLPLYHVFALEEGLLAGSFVGGTIITTPGFSPKLALDMMQRHDANDFLGVPSMLVALLNHPDIAGYQFPHLYALMAAAAPAPVPLWKRAVDVLGLTEICTGYGGTEVTASTVHTEVGDPIEVVSTRVGRIKPGGVTGLPEYGGANVQYKLVDPDTGHDLTPDKTFGELAVRGNIVTKGYYKNPEANAASIDIDGWFRTGDLGRLHDGGYIEMLGRNKEMYKVSGENVSAKEVEEVISQHPFVSQCYVVGVQDALTDQAGVAFVELKPGTSCTRREIVSHCQSRLAKFKIPRHVFFVTASEWPMTGTGKIQKFQLQRIAEQRIRGGE